MRLKNKMMKTTVTSMKKPSASKDGGVATAELTDGLVKMTLKRKEDQITLICLTVHHSYIIKWYTKNFVDFTEVEFQHKGVNDPNNPECQVSLKDSKTLQILCATPQMFSYPNCLKLMMGHEYNVDDLCVNAQNDIMQLFHKEYKSAMLVFPSNEETQLVNLPAEVTNPIDTKEFQFKSKVILKGRHVQYNTIIRCVMPCLFQCTQAPKKLKPKAFDVDPDQLKSDDGDDELEDGGDNDECLGMTGVESPSKKR
jgi:hypothetical protein